MPAITDAPSERPLAMPDQIDLIQLSVRESEQVEWKENVADADDVVRTLSAFANDWANLGGGYVVCGAKEQKGPHGFPELSLVGLTAARLKEVEGRVLTACRERVSPPITPTVQELPTPDPERRVLVFIMPATRTAHIFRSRESSGYYVRISRETREARNGILRELLVRKGVSEEWDRRACSTATIEDLDLLALRDALQRMNVFHIDRGIEEYLSDTKTLSPFVPPLFIREPLTGILRPRNFALLLFGRTLQNNIPGAYALFSIYQGSDRSEPHAERHELAGTIVAQARRLVELLDVQSYVAYDKTNRSAPNAVKYPPQALHEAMVNALAHRDYEIVEPTRVTVFSDRIEILSPGSLPTGISVDEFRSGRAIPKWRNQSLAWFLNRLQLAQAEGQGIPTIIRSMREEGCPAPRFDVNEVRVTCVLPSHPRHSLAREHRLIEEAISLGEFERARQSLDALLAQDLLNVRTLQLFAEVQRALNAPAPLLQLLKQLENHLDNLPPQLLAQFADVFSSDAALSENHAVAKDLYLRAASRGVAEQEIRQVAVGLSRSGAESEALDFLDRQFHLHPELRENPWLLRIRGNTLIGLAKLCIQTGKNRELPGQTRKRAWESSRRYLASAETDFRRAISLSPDHNLTAGLQTGLEFVGQLKKRATPPANR